MGKQSEDGFSENAMNNATASITTHSTPPSQQLPENASAVGKGVDSKLATYVEWFEANKLLHTLNQRDDFGALMDKVEHRERKLLDEIYGYSLRQS